MSLLKIYLCGYRRQCCLTYSFLPKRIRLYALTKTCFLIVDFFIR